MRTYPQPAISQSLSFGPAGGNAVDPHVRFDLSDVRAAASRRLRRTARRTQRAAGVR